MSVGEGMTDKQATALGSFCGLAQYIKDNPNAIYWTNGFIQKRMVEILNEYKEQQCKQ